MALASRIADARAEADLAMLAERLAAGLDVRLPPGGGPFPVVIQMHGCGGLQPFQARYAERARRIGVAAVVVDSFGPRGLGKRAAQLSVCTGARLRGRERSADLLAMLQWLEGQPWADAGRIAAAGWSHGGWAVMEALVGPAPSARSQARLDALRAALLVYPYAGPLARTAASGWSARPQVHAWLAGRDAVVGRAAPLRALERLRADGLDVRTVIHADATHAFDDDLADDPRSRYRPDLAEATEDLFAAALSESLLDRAVPAPGAS